MAVSANDWIFNVQNQNCSLKSVFFFLNKNPNPKQNKKSLRFTDGP